MEITLDQLNFIQNNRYTIFKQDIDKLYATGNFCELDIVITILLPLSLTRQRIEAFFEEEKVRQAKEREEKAAKAERDRVKREAAAARKAVQEKEDLKQLLKTTAKKLGVTVELELSGIKQQMLQESCQDVARLVDELKSLRNAQDEAVNALIRYEESRESGDVGRILDIALKLRRG